jgi:hypothetical protein
MKKPWFIMTYSQIGEHMQPLIGNPEFQNKDDFVCGFKTRAEAVEAAKRHPLATAFGYEIFSVDRAN